MATSAKPSKRSIFERFESANLWFKLPPETLNFSTVSSVQFNSFQTRQREGSLHGKDGTATAINFLHRIIHRPKRHTKNPLMLLCGSNYDATLAVFFYICLEIKWYL